MVVCCFVCYKTFAFLIVGWILLQDLKGLHSILDDCKFYLRGGLRPPFVYRTVAQKRVKIEPVIGFYRSYYSAQLLS